MADKKYYDYNLIFIFIGKLTKIIQYLLIKITIDIVELFKFIINIIPRNFSRIKFIVNDKNLFLYLNSSYHFTIFLVLNKKFLLFFTSRLITKKTIR